MAEAEQEELEQLLISEVFAILHGQPLPPRTEKAQKLLFSLVASSKCPQTSHVIIFSALEDVEYKESEDWIL